MRSRSVALGAFGLFLAVFFLGISFAYGGTEYQEFDCAHRLRIDPQSVGADGGWVSADPGWFQTRIWTIEYQDRALFTTTSALTLTNVVETATWSCYYMGTPPQSRLWDLLHPLLPAMLVQVDTVGDFESQYFPVGAPTWTPIPPEETPIPTATPEPTPETYVLEVLVNSPEGAGGTITTTHPFDLVVNLYTSYSGCVQILFQGPGVEVFVREGTPGVWIETDSIFWQGFPSSSGHVEIVLRSLTPVFPQETWEYTVGVRTATEEEPLASATVWVFNPTPHQVFLPLVQTP